MIEAGTILQGRYRVEKQIGQGGMGAVFIATDERFGSTVAIKETFFTDEKFRKAFEREARLLNSLRHAALPRVSDHFIDGNGQFLVMEFIDGDDLSEQLETEGKVFAVEEVLGWAVQLLDALEYLHSQEMPVIHRDIKPQNLKLTTRGQIILLDFGLAKGNVTNPESATAAKSVFGYSRNYASLEQIQGTGTDPRSDLYSLAATLYHLLTGVPPADALTRAMNVLSDKPDPLIEAHKIRAEIPLGVSRILYEAMALNAEQRPASAQAMREMLLEVKTEAPSENAEAFANAPNTNIYSQKTQIYGDASQISKFRQSEIKTETFSNEESKVTRIKPQVVTGDLAEKSAKVYPLTATVENGKKPRRGLAIGAVISGLILALGALAAVYVAKPEVFGIQNSNPANTNVDKKSILVQVPTENTNIAETNTNAQNTNSLVENPSNTNISTDPKQKETVVKNEPRQTETRSKPEPPVPTKRNQNPAIDEPPDITVDDTDPDNEPPTNPKTKQKFPVFVWRGMTPQERQKLREALELQRKQQEIERRKRETQRRSLPPPPQTPQN
jgi:serine/threonine protein kinase